MGHIDLDTSHNQTRWSLMTLSLTSSIVNIFLFPVLKFFLDAKSQSKLMEPKFKEMKQKAQEANLDGVQSQHIQVQALLHIKIKLIVE